MESKQHALTITDLFPDNEAAIQQVAQLLIDGFIHSPGAWKDMETALAEVHESFGPNNISRIAINEQQQALGWIAGYSAYDGNVWELHPLVVSIAHQGQGIGRKLVLDFEERVKERGALTITLGTDDEDYRTTLSGVDLYPNIWEHITSIKNIRRHPYEFYQKLGYVIIGVIPDANGPGKPDILMAKSIASKATR
ncbi:aminoglycoside N-acetyltransferase AAC(6')-Ii [Reticulibacter mediterranei]|uniref:Aminoglycoside N-acetyltransferase AAC(6')-Ii n=1 Tax=Reticulibacter mediterranei TaxID=2778369 RepID=A0A8J3ILB2_9CHLR|nr:GNAT family N-acetyltransferase [Reticulibacter mediterranei]GHO91626.1 aminoglycoside N-acetyltransferase AAC(6')-Ii [Reticulibacter mediterranei]